MSNQTLRTVAVIVGFLLFWEAACRLFNLPTYFLPAPSLVLAEICAEPRWYLEHCGYTLFTTALGFGLAVVVGVIAAVGITYSKLLESAFHPARFAEQRPELRSRHSSSSGWDRRQIDGGYLVSDRHIRHRGGYRAWVALGRSRCP
jgi:hypothetical protein